MHSLLESYLSEVAARLKGLPAARRNEELREMRAHLLSSVEAYQELGETEQEAVRSTLRQFGPPARVAGGLLHAWRRGSWRESAQAGLLGAAMLWGVFGLGGSLGHYLEGHHALFPTLWSHFEPVFYVLLFGLSALGGGLSAGRSVRGTARGVAWGAGLGYVAPMALWEVIHAWNDSDIAPLSSILLLQAACLTGTAWAVSRRREQRAGRTARA